MAPGIQDDGDHDDYARNDTLGWLRGTHLRKARFERGGTLAECFGSAGHTA